MLFEALMTGKLLPLNEWGGPLTFDTPESLLRAYVLPEPVNNWLKAEGLRYEWTPSAAVSQDGTWHAQEEAILAEIIRQGLKPTEFPPQMEVGKGSPKSNIYERLKRREPDLFHSRGVFDKAWERLRAYKLIIDRSP